MSRKLLGDVFRKYNANLVKVGEVTVCLNSVIEAFLDSEQGAAYTAEPIDTKSANRKTFQIESGEPDEYNQTHRIVVDVMAEGTVRILSSWQQGSDPNSDVRVERSVHFSSEEDAADIAAKTLSAMADMSDHELSDAIRSFANSPAPEVDAAPHA